MAAKDYDVLIIGSGASGGMAAYTLTQKGIMNSREWNASGPASGGRRGGGIGLYWNPI